MNRITNVKKGYETPAPIFVKDAEGFKSIFADISKGMKHREAEN